ncbi:YggS family pyridoxal phosphate-dependent enzyme [Nocardioides sp. R-C-SC26]|uniref:YggS family pyridoxal phosphate-dependent enzyme n=1 Tax=Nocardioides sp. R-C-SC26 TaxID=2870414 RepID=UPI001E380EA7|nr:YggS family pyridoxal phosphate-dependent enzyme [Nocardioides sp. R-C-SC26]
MTAEREVEVAASLAIVRQRIARAASAAGRDTDEITLVVVTKYFPASDVRLLAALGVTDVAENRHQEAVEKSEACADLDLRWHFVGGLQSNKATAVTRYADVVQSVDRLKLVAPLARGAQERGRALDVALQVSLDPPDRDHRAGVRPEELSDLAAAVASVDGLRLRGLMAVAPLDERPADAFDRLAGVREGFLAEHPDARWLSAGMSADLEDAITRGATHVRIGSAVLGSRPGLQ